MDPGTSANAVDPAAAVVAAAVAAACASPPPLPTPPHPSASERLALVPNDIPGGGDRLLLEDLPVSAWRR